MLGLKHTTVKLVPHSYKWHYLFQEEVINIRHALNNKHLQMEHVGSTALPNIAAKPILDIFIPHDDLSTVNDYADALAALGYELVTDAQAYKLFIKGSEESRTHHLTFTSPSGTYWTETLQFRDHLLDNPDIAKAYESEKIHLASQYATSRRNYSSNKARFIQTVLRSLKAEVSPTLNTTPNSAINSTQLSPPSLLSTHVNSSESILISQSDLDNFSKLNPTLANSAYKQVSGQTRF